jgi:Stealth protein CR1, conserved region 1
VTAQPIDLVFTWVDAEDPAWRRSKRTWMERVGLEAPATDEQCGDLMRYDNMREIVYAVRSARLYAPWLRSIYVLVADGQEVPAALADGVEVFGLELAAAVAHRFRDEDRSLFWQLLVYSLEGALGAPRHVRSMNANVVPFDAVERSAVARLVVFVRLLLLSRFAPHTACFNTIPASWRGIMHRYFTEHLAIPAALPASPWGDPFC